MYKVDGTEALVSYEAHRIFQEAFVSEKNESELRVISLQAIRNMALEPRTSLMFLNEGMLPMSNPFLAPIIALNLILFFQIKECSSTLLLLHST